MVWVWVCKAGNLIKHNAVQDPRLTKVEGSFCYLAARNVVGSHSCKANGMTNHIDPAYILFVNACCLDAWCWAGRGRGHFPHPHSCCPKAVAKKLLPMELV